jgi:succinate dehydrogenase / fumarate reductase membrane anchor subunit
VSLRTPLGRVLGKGSAGHGAGHWWAQRVTSVALVPLALWFAISLATLPSLDYVTLSTWMSGTWTAVLLILFVVAVAHHSHAGLQVVVEDYLHGTFAKFASLLALLFAHLVLGAAAVFAVLRIAFGSVA